MVRQSTGGRRWDPPLVRQVRRCETLTWEAVPIRPLPVVAVVVAAAAAVVVAAVVVAAAVAAVAVAAVVAAAAAAV